MKTIICDICENKIKRDEIIAGIGYRPIRKQYKIKIKEKTTSYNFDICESCMNKFIEHVKNTCDFSS